MEFSKDEIAALEIAAALSDAERKLKAAIRAVGRDASHAALRRCVMALDTYIRTKNKRDETALRSVNVRLKAFEAVSKLDQALIAEALRARDRTEPAGSDEGPEEG